MQQLRKLSNDNKGMVAIMVAVFLVLIVSLVVVNYSRLVRREQRQILDRQLNTQALYVAESGIDNIAQIIEDNPSAISDKTDCINQNIGGVDTNFDFGPGSELEVTCTLVDTSLEELPYDGVSQSPEVIPLDGNGTNINTVTIRWSNDGDFNVGDCDYPDFPANFPVGCTPGLLKIDLVNTNGGINVGNILNSTFTAYLYPSSGGDNGMSWNDADGPTKQGHIEEVKCDATECQTTISGLGSTKYHMRVQSLYNNSDITICANGCSLELHNALASIDVTARAVDVIRRIKAYVPVSGYSSTDGCNNAALCVSENICKQYSVIPPDPANGEPGSVTGCGLSP